MAKKAFQFNDNEAFEKIIAAEKPAAAKNIGREVKNFSADSWNVASYSIVLERNQHKFSQHEDLKVFLQKTGDKIIVEASPAEAIWALV